MTRLDQEAPGQPGALARLLGAAGVNVPVQHNDHAGNLVLVVAGEHTTVCGEVIERWEQG
jgi:hypothetical protein